MLLSTFFLSLKFYFINYFWEPAKYQRAFIHFSGTTEQNIKIKLNAKDYIFEKTIKPGELLYIIANEIDNDIYNLTIGTTSAIFESRTVGYTKKWLLETSDNNKYSTIFFRNGYEPIVINGIGTGSTLFENFKNSFYETINSENLFNKGMKARILALILASVLWSIIIFSIIKLIFSKLFRNYFLSLKNLHLYIAYFFSLWALFLMFGNYWAEVYFVPSFAMHPDYVRLPYSIFQQNFMLLFTDYFFGAKAMCLQFVIPYAFISMVVFKICKKFVLSKYICFLVPLLLFLVPSVNLALVNAFWLAKEGGLWWLLSCLSTFYAFYYLKDKKQKIVIIFSIFASVISTLHRFDFIVIVPVICLFWLYSKKYSMLKKCVYSFIVFISILVLFLYIFKSAPSGRSSILINQYFFAYLHPKFYSNNTFKEDEIEKFAINKKNEIASETLLEIVSKNYSFSDYHYIYNYLNIHKLLVYVPAIDKKTLILKIIKNPYPVIYARFNTLFVSLIPKTEWGSAWQVGHFINNSKDKNVLDYPIEPKHSIHYKSLSKLYEGIYGSKIIKNYLLYGVGPLMVLIMILSFIFWKKAPITALINIPTLLYLGVLFLINIAAGGWYYYGGHLVAIFSIPLFFIEMKLRKDRELIKQ